MVRIRMHWKEVAEGRRVGIPEPIIGKIEMGMELTEKEKGIVRDRGKVYVEAHEKDGKLVRPHLRDLPGGSKAMVRVSSSMEKSLEDAEVTVAVYKGRETDIENLDYFKVRLPSGKIYKIIVDEVEPSDSPRED